MTATVGVQRRSDPRFGRLTRNLLSALSLGTCVAAYGAAPASAATTVWQGSGATSDWSDATNWSNGVPTDGDKVVLSESGAQAPSNYDLNLTVSSLTLNTSADPATRAIGYLVNNAGGFTFGLESGGIILDQASNVLPDHLDMGITLNGPATIKLAPSARGLVIGGTGITGAGQLTVSENSSTGFIEFDADNTYTGGTIIESGTLQLGHNGTTGSILGDVVNHGKLVFNRSNDLVFGGVISADGAVQQTGFGTTILTGENTYAGGTEIRIGTLQIGDGGTTGSIIGDVLDRAALIFNRSDNLTFAGTISGAGTLTQSGAGSLILIGSNTFTGGTTVNAGVLQLGNGGATGSITGNITDNAIVAFNRSNTLTYSGFVSGTGALQQNGAGTLVLTGDSTYSGGTVINAGILQLGNGGTSGSILGDIVDNASLTVNRSSALTIGGNISGTGGFSQSGSGTTTLTGASTYTGATTVNGGTLLVNGSLVSTVTVNTGATLGGIGDVGNVIVADGGTLSPGASGSAGTLHVDGDLTLNSGATYNFDATSGSNDRVIVSGAAALDGTLVLNPTGTFSANQSIALIDATGALTGQFTTVSLAGAFGASLIPIVSYDGHHASLTLLDLAAVPGAGTNGVHVGQAIAFAIGHFNEAQTAFSSLGGAPLATVASVVGQMAGEESTGFKTAASGSANRLVSDMLDPSIGGRGTVGDGGGAARRYSASSGASVWVVVDGASNKIDAHPGRGAHETTVTNYGGEWGLDVRRNNANGHVAFGGAVGYAKEKWELVGAGNGEATSWEAGLYLSLRARQSYFDAAAMYGIHSAHIDRDLILAGTNTYRAKFNGNSFATRLEWGHAFRLPVGRLIPYLRLQSVFIYTPAYDETTLAGSASYALSYHSTQYFDTTTELGAGWDTILGGDPDSLTDLHGRIGWLHDLSGGLRDVASFTAFPGASFTVNGAQPSYDAAHLTLGIEHDMGPVAFTLNGDGVIGSTSRSFGGTGSISYRW